MTSPHNWPFVLTALVRGEHLSADAAAWAMEEIMSGQATSVQVAGFAVALRAKGETVDEVEGLVRAMYDHATLVNVGGPSVDIVGTGGDRARTVNISTMAGIVVAGAGARVVKHGNRAASSQCGSADLLEELGVRLDLDAAAVAKVFHAAGITFCFAPQFHPGLRHAAGARKELGIATTFNFLGPLANPARPTAQAVGVVDERMAAVMAGVLARRGTSALVFRGDDGLDELTTTTTSHVWVVRDGKVSEERLGPDDVGLPTSAPEALRGGDPATNAAVTRALLAGERGAVRDAVLLNAAAALAAYEPSDDPLVDRLRAGIERAAASIDSGAAAAVLERWVAASQQL